MAGRGRGGGGGRGGGRGGRGGRSRGNVGLQRGALAGGKAGPPVGGEGFGKRWRERRSDERTFVRSHGRGGKRARRDWGDARDSQPGDRPTKHQRTESGEESESEEAPPGETSAYDALVNSLRSSAPTASASQSDEESDEDEDEDEQEEAAGSGSDLDSGAEEEEEEAAAAAEDEGAEPGASLRRAPPVDPTVDPPPNDAAVRSRLERLLSESEVALLRAPASAAWRAAGTAPLPPQPGLREASWEVCESPLVSDASQLPLPEMLDSPADYPLPPSLLARWSALHPPADAAASAPPRPAWDSPLQRSLFSMLASQRDVLFTARGAPPPPGEASDEVMDAVLLHSLSHLLHTRSRILHNSEKLRKRALAAAMAQQAPLAAATGRAPTRRYLGDPSALAGSDVPQDQGFTRPKLLLLVPMRSTALRWVQRALEMLPAAQGRPGEAVTKLDRLESEYGPRPDEVPRGESGEARSTRGRPADFKRLFSGNRDDHFRLGMKLTRKSVRLFTDFGGSDIIVASPLGLATRLQQAPEGGGGAADFLSSIELVVCDGLDVCAMQNWAHLETVFDALNQLPRGSQGGEGATDIMRVRPWYLNGWAGHYRQSILLASQPSPQLQQLLRGRCSNFMGSARLRLSYTGLLGTVRTRATQEFSRLAAPTPGEAADARFRAFKARLWPLLKESGGGDLLFVPSYFDYVRLRNFLKKEGASFVGNNEYSDASEVGCARADFGSRQAHIMLYSERAHFFRRHSIRGAVRITFYGPPEHAAFYPELLNALEQPMGGALAEVACLFTRWDAPQLERLVGSARAKRMISGVDSQFLFC